MAVHVSIHDVSPAWEREVETALEMTHAAGVRPALLVVPDFHGRAPLLAHPAFCERLRRLEAEGHEIYLHGYYHRAGASPPRDGGSSLRDRAAWLFAQKVVSGGEAELSDVSRDEARKRMDDGERVLREAGLTVRGYVAPAWSMPRWVLPLLAERGYAFTEDHTRVYDPRGGRSRASLVLNYASRTPARLLSSVAFCRLARPARRLVPARIAIHPADMRVALLRSETASLLAWARGDFVDAGSALLS
ncbi:MAG: polysaccharide deacetylase family protein [Labilithrix sp.]|nr:polysaccharide deacetylase family protein [Labilithrix sp.]